MLADSKGGERYSFFEKGLKELLRREFPNSSLFTVVSEKKKYRAELEGSWGQQRGKEPEVCEVYFDHTYLCDINESLRPEEAKSVILFNLMQKGKFKK